MDAQTAVLIGALAIVLGVLAYVLWQARGATAGRYQDMDGSHDAAHRTTVRPARRAPALPPDVRPHVEALVAQGRPARAINLILKQTELEIEDAHAVVDATAAKVAKPGQHAWQAAREAKKEAERRSEEATGAKNDGDYDAAISAGLAGLDRAAQVKIERLVQVGKSSEAVELIKEITGMTTAEAKASLIFVRAQIGRGGRGGAATRPNQSRASAKARQPKPAPRRSSPPGGGGRKR